MLFEVQPPQQLPETPSAIIEQVQAVDPRDDIVQKFFDSAAQAFEDGKIAGKSEDEIIEITATLVLQILIAKNLWIDEVLMKAFLKQKRKIEEAFPKPTTTEITPEPVFGTLTIARKRFQDLFKGVLI